MAKFFFWLILLMLPALILGAPALLLISAIQSKPLVAEPPGLRHEDAGRVTDLLKVHDPRDLRDGETRHLEISDGDINLILNSALSRIRNQRVRVNLGDGQANIHYSHELPASPQRRFLNISAYLVQDGPLLAVRHLDFGDLGVPGWLVAPLIAAADRFLRGRYPEYVDAIAVIKEMDIQPGKLTMVYQWKSGLVERLQTRGRDLLLPTEERRRILVYYTEIARQSDSLDRGAVSLDRLLQPLFGLALRRSREGNDPAAENRAILLALGVVLSGNSVRHLVGEQGMAAGVPRSMKLVLRGRGDLALHFGISAAITAAGGSGLAGNIGVFKEVDDSRGGSGFSFADLLADRSGIAFAEVALGKNAAALQVYMSSRVRESGYMPGFTELPEGLMELEFKARYEDLDSASYALVNDEIERRIGTCAIHQPGFG